MLFQPQIEPQIARLTKYVLFLKVEIKIKLKIIGVVRYEYMPSIYNIAILILKAN